MPVVFAEFGVSTKDPGYNSSYRDALLTTVYTTLLNSTKKGGSGAGSLLWQLFPEGTDYMDDGYAIFLSKSASTSKIISPSVLGSVTGAARRNILGTHFFTLMNCKIKHEKKKSPKMVEEGTY